MSTLRQRFAEAFEQGDPVDVVFTAEIRLFPEDVADAGHSIAQAIQNQIGSSGAKILEVDYGS